ncbi:hypothetical protein P9139_05015 [Curtobacterium flaccumfaciens]|nr:hypothetical protein P9139_05015 [Curtobacterium flaccumfaciens]
MTTILQPTPARSTVRATDTLDSVLGRLELAAARLPHALAVPVMVAHAALSSLAYR